MAIESDALSFRAWGCLGGAVGCQSRPAWPQSEMYRSNVRSTSAVIILAARARFVRALLSIARSIDHQPIT